MKRKVSEFSYGFVLTHELVNAYGYLRTDAPHGSRGGRKKGAEDGAGAAPRGYPLFLQFKASEYMKRRNAGESKLVGLPYFRFAQVVASSLFVNPGEIGELPDNRPHRVVFSGRSEDVYVCSKPQRLGGVIHGAVFAAAVRQAVSEREAQSLDDEFFDNLAGDMVSLISPNRRIFDELSGGKVEMSASTFANYLAKTLFDCELLIVPS